MEAVKQENETNGKQERLNTIWAGMLIGILLGGSVYLLLLLLFFLLPAIGQYITDQRIPLLLAMVPNLLLMRNYLVGRKMEKAGKGILVVTFVGIVGAFLVF